MSSKVLDEDILNYISLSDYNDKYNSLKTGESLVIYQDKKIRIRLNKVGKRVFLVKTIFGDEGIDKIAKNILLIQA